MSRSYHGQITKRSCFWNTHTWVTVSGHSCHCHYVDRNIICHHFVKFLYGGHAVIQNLRQVLTHHSGLVSFEVVKQWAYSGFCNKEILFRWHIPLFQKPDHNQNASEPTKSCLVIKFVHWSNVISQTVNEHMTYYFLTSTFTLVFFSRSKVLIHQISSVWIYCTWTRK